MKKTASLYFWWPWLETHCQSLIQTLRGWRFVVVATNSLLSNDTLQSSLEFLFASTSGSPLIFSLL